MIADASRAVSRSMIYPWITICLLTACSMPPDGRVDRAGQTLAIVADTAVFKAIQVVQVHAFRATTQGGASLTCSDIPGGYRESDAQLAPAIDPAPAVAMPADRAAPVVFKDLGLPADEALVLVVRGLAQYDKGTFVVGRGCIDNQRFEAGSSSSVSIDLKATTGRACSKPADCEPNTVCVSGAGFADGYCAMQGCAGGKACPPGSACVSDAAHSGLCMRLCDSISDCEIASGAQDCQGRPGLAADGCPEVCVHFTWQASSCCSRCPGGDGGV